jgi:hypothetical protein
MGLPTPLTRASRKSVPKSPVSAGGQNSHNCDGSLVLKGIGAAASLLAATKTWGVARPCGHSASSGAKHSFFIFAHRFLRQLMCHGQLQIKIFALDTFLFRSSSHIHRVSVVHFYTPIFAFLCNELHRRRSSALRSPIFGQLRCHGQSM